MGPCCAVYTPLEPEDLSPLVHQVLIEHADEVSSTRRGIYWEVRIDGRPIVVNITTRDRYDSGDEDELLSRDLLPEDVPARVGLAAGLKSDTDYDILAKLAASIASRCEGFSTPPVK